MLRRITLISVTISAFFSSDIGVRRSFAQARLKDFEEVDASLYFLLRLSKGLR